MRAAVLYTKLAPYHAARLRATARRGAMAGHELVAIEAASAKSDYRWPAHVESGRDVRLVTLFPDADYLALPRARIRRATVAALDAADPDVVVVPGWSSALATGAFAWALRRGVPRVVISDSQPEDRRQDPLRIGAKRIIVSRYQAAFVAGAPHARWLVELGMPAHRCFTGCDVVDNAWYAERARRAVRTEDPVVRIVSALRLLPRKNAVGALEELAASGVDWRWDLMGDGPERETIAARAQALGVGSRLRMLGHVPDEDVPQRLASADVYLQPSLVEQWGLAVNEAMACGLPVLVSRRCGCREDLVQEGVNGHLFDPTRRGSLSAALARFAAKREQWAAMGEASRKIIAAWGLDAFADSFWRACACAREDGRPSRTFDRALALALGGW